MRWLLVLALVSACSKKEPPPRNAFEAFERAYVRENQALARAMRSQGRQIADKDIPKSYRAVYVEPAGVWIDRTLVATLAELETKRAEIIAAIAAIEKELPSEGYTGLVVTFDLEEEPSSVVIAALRWTAGRQTSFSVRRSDPEVPLRATETICETTVRDQPSVQDAETVNLSVLLDEQHTWVGLSRVNEFQDIPDIASERDVEKLRYTLREHKASALFDDRTDLELAAPSGTAGGVIAAFGTACDVGFIDIAVLDRDQLSANPQL